MEAGEHLPGAIDTLLVVGAGIGVDHLAQERDHRLLAFGEPGHDLGFFGVIVLIAALLVPYGTVVQHSDAKAGRVALRGGRSRAKMEIDNAVPAGNHAQPPPLSPGPAGRVGGTSMTLFSRLLYTVIAFTLLAAAILLIGVAVWRTATGFWTGENALESMLDGISLIIIAVAVADVGKFLFEEEVLSDRELRRPAEARGSLTKFMTIIIIALHLEALVLIAKTSRETMGDIVYPGLLVFLAATRWWARPVPEAQPERHGRGAAGSDRRQRDEPQLRAAATET